MKKLTLTLTIAIISIVSIFAQAPQSFKYQAVVRNNAGEIITGQVISIKASILQDSEIGTLVYSETHNDSTNQFGLIVLEIGQGNVESGIFKDIKWGINSFFLKLEMDETGGTNYQLMGTSQFLTVPYSLHTTTSERFLNLTSAQRDSMTNIPTGYKFFNTSTNSINYYNGIHWVELIGSCTPDPTQADAGPDQADPIPPIYLSANTPEYGSGIWTLISGTGGNIDNPSDPHSTFSGIADSSYTLRWTISNFCDSTYDEVNISLTPDSLSCPGIPIVSYNGQTYLTIKIGGQCWFRENLNIGTMINGSSDQTNNSIIEKYCYDDNTSNCDTLGGLYQWNEMMQYSTSAGTQGICPDGWHLPTDAQWCTLEQEVDPTVSCTFQGWRGEDVATKLKHGGSSGFNALMTGYRNGNGLFGSRDTRTYFYTSTYFTQWAWSRYIEISNPQVYRTGYTKVQGFSVRCLKDGQASNQSPDTPSNPSPADGAINITIDTTLSWSCSDPDGDDLTYKIYFGTVDPPPFVEEGLTEALYDPGILEFNTTYYWKIVAFDVYGDSAVGIEWSFFTEYEHGQPCPGIPTFDYDGQTYTTVQIGTQCWMKENLNIGVMINGSQNQQNNDTIEKHCYENNPANCVIYGGLYQWDEMMQYVTIEGAQGICPTGWHLPTDAEWCTLENEVDAGTVSCIATGNRGIDAGLNLKSTSGWYDPLGSGTDLYGFTALPGGYCNSSDYFYSLLHSAYFWSSDESTSLWAWQRSLHLINDGISRNANNKTRGFSVRCLKD